MSDAYTAIFCRECGAHLNDVDLQDDADTYHPNFGSLVKCGWCGLQTRDWSHIPQCRKTWKAKEALERQRVSRSLEQMLIDMGEETGSPVASHVPYWTDVPVGKAL